MDYIQKYREALARARELSKTITGANYEYIFPELKESKSERIKRVLVDYFKRYKGQEERGGSTMFCGIPTDDILAWFEKQGKNNMGISEATREKLEDNLYKALEKETPESWNEFLDEQGKQKELNLVEILKHYPRETELYSPLYGKLWLAEVDEENEIITCYKYPLDEGCTRAILEQENTISFYSNGTTGLPDCTISKDCMLFLYNKNQSEQKPSEWSEEDENGLGDALWAIKQARTVAKDENDMGTLWYAERWLKSIKDRIQSKPRKKNIEQNLAKKYGITGIDSKHAEGKLGEMIKKKIETENVDNANKIETEFHEGDWVVLKDGGNFSNGNKFAQIDSIELDEEMCYLDTGRWLYPSEIRPWTIDDAAAGDILTDENDNPFIYCGHDPDYWKYITAYCGISFGEFTVYDKPFLWSSDTVEPATQEQRDSLLQKMKESGYAWNSEKKELKKI